ncbi:MAG: 3-oxoacyl-[acyl-carrier-protein] synthase III C-terminal domain-containing protein [Acidimicrobiales bacterium]
MTPAPCFVGDLGVALGRRKLSVEESVAAGRTRSGEAELLQAGFRFHHVCDDDDTAYELARAAVTPMMSRLAGTDAVIYATCLPTNANLAPASRFEASGDVKDLMDYPASRLQVELGLDEAIVIGVGQQACTSMLGSVRLARGLLASEPEMSRVLCITADRFPPGARYEQAYSLISDGAAACVVSRHGGDYRIVAAHHITNGAMVSADDDETVGAYFSYTHRLVVELLAKAGRTSADVAWVVPQNTDPKAWRILARLLAVDEARVFAASLPDVAHVISSDNIVNLSWLEGRGVLESGDLVVLVMAGYGMNWQALLVEKT